MFATATEWVAKKMNGKGNLLLVTGVPGTDTDNQRNKGIKETLAKYPDIKIIGSVNGMWSLAVIEKVVSRVMATHKWSEVDGIVGSGGGWSAWQQETAAGIKTGGTRTPMTAPMPLGSQCFRSARFPMRRRPMRQWAQQACLPTVLLRPARWRSNWP